MNPSKPLSLGRLPVLLCFALASCATGNPYPRIVDACEALVLDYAYYRDREDLELAGQRVAALFTEDATLTVNGQSFRGKRAIYERIVNQANAPLTAHMMSTIRIFPTGQTTATGVSYATVYIAPKSTEGSARANGFTAIGEYQDEFALTPEGWRIAKRNFITRIQPASPNTSSP